MIILGLFSIWITLLSGIVSQNEGVIYIEPPGTIVRYLGDDLSLTCHHSVQLSRPMWIANGSLLEDASNPLNEFVTFIDNPPHLGYSEITIHNMTKEVNGTIIYCFAEVSSSSKMSNNIIVLLQGKLEAVRSLDFRIDGRDLLITWSPPFTLDRRRPIRYKVKILNESSDMEISDVLTFDNFIMITPNDLRLITCDDFNISVIPMNKLGCGNSCTLSIKSAALLDANASAIPSTRQSTLDLVVGVTSFLCSITNIVINNINLNKALSFTVFNDFNWYDSGFREPHYLLILDLDERFLYEIEMTLNNNKGNLTKKFAISTHELKNVEIAELNGQIHAILQYSIPSQERNGVFLMLLYCQNIQCASFNFTKSIFLSIYGGLEMVIFDKPYYSGFFKSFAFDTYRNGSIRSSAGLIDQTYPIPTSEFLLFFGSSEGIDSNDGSCSYQYNNESLFSSCNTNTVRPSDEQQIVQIPSDFGQGGSLVISNCYPLNESACIGKNNQTEFIISVIVSSGLNLEKNEPLGKHSISTEDYSDINRCSNGTTPPAKGYCDLALKLGLGIGLSVLLAIIISIITAVAIYLKCKKTRKDDLNLHHKAAP